jgi:hypothetical protein
VHTQKNMVKKIDHAIRNTDLFEVAAHLGEGEGGSSKIDRRQQTKPCPAHLLKLSLLAHANKLLKVARCSQKPTPAQWLYPKRSDITHRPMPHSIIIIIIIIIPESDGACMTHPRRRRRRRRRRRWRVRLLVMVKQIFPFQLSYHGYSSPNCLHLPIPHGPHQSLLCFNSLFPQIRQNLLTSMAKFLTSSPAKPLSLSISLSLSTFLLNTVYCAYQVLYRHTYWYNSGFKGWGFVALT